MEPSGLAVALEIPFRDEHGALRRQTLPAIAVERKNDRVIATFRLADRWDELYKEADRSSVLVGS